MASRMAKAETGTIVPKCEGYHQGISATKKRATHDKGPINHQLINKACEVFFLRRGIQVRDNFDERASE
jgi:hypothetical protein